VRSATLPAPGLGEPRVPVGVVQIAIVAGLTAVLATAGFVVGLDPLKSAGVAAGVGVVIGSCLSSEFGIAVLLATFAIFQRDGLDFAALPFFGGGLKPTDLMLAATLGGWMVRTIVRGTRARALPAVEVKLLLAFLAWAAVGILIGAAHNTVVKEGVTELRPLLHLLLFVCVATEFDRAAVRRVVWLLMLLAIPLTIHTVILYGRGVGDFNKYVGGVRVLDVEFGYLMIPVLLGISFFLDGDGPGLITLALAAISFVGLSMTFYRMAFLGLAGGLITLLLLASGRGRRLFVVGFWIVAAGTVAASAWYAAGGNQKRDPISALERRVASIGDYDNDVSAQHRLHEWATARQMIAQHPILGNGMGARVGFHSPMFNPLTNTYGFWSHDTYIHNVYLWLLTKLGIIGFALLIGFVVTALVHGARRIRLAPPGTRRSVPAGLIASIVALMISSFFGRILTLPTITPFVAFALGSLYVWWPNEGVNPPVAVRNPGMLRSRIAARA
jgi:O-antigen ligase